MKEITLRKVPRAGYLLLAGIVSLGLFLAACEAGTDLPVNPTPTQPSQEQTPTPEPTHEPEPGPARASVQSVNLEMGTVDVLLETGEALTLFVDESTVIMVNGVPGSLEDIADDEAVAVEYDIVTLAASSITVGATGTAQNEAGTGVVGIVDPTFGLVDITLDTGEAITFSVDDSTEITIDGQPGALEDLTEGHNVSVVYDPASRLLVSIDATIENGNDDGQPEGVQSGSGSLSTILQGAGILVIALDSGESVTLTANSSTIITINGGAGNLASLEEGATVVFDYDTDTLTAVNINATQSGGNNGGVSEPGVEPVAVNATVSSIDLEVQRIRVMVSIGNNLDLWITQDTTITIDGIPAPLADVSTGASAAISYDPDTLRTVSVAIETPDADEEEASAA